MWSVKTQEEWNCEFRVILSEKGERWVRGRANPELQENGSVISSGFLSDITQEKEISELNRQLRREFEDVLDNVPNLIFVKDLDGKYIMANKAAREYFHQSEDEIIGKEDVDLGIDKDMAIQFKETDRNVVDSGEPFFVPEDKSINPSGEVVFHQTIKVPFQQVGSDEPAVLAVVTDITDRKRKELELNETLDIVGEQNKRLLNFAHIVSHNLRAPIANIIGVADLLENSNQPEEVQKQLLKEIFNNVGRLDNVMQDLNDTLKLKAELSKKRESVKLKSLIQNIIASNQNLIYKEYVSIITDFRLIDEVYTVKSYLYSAFFNLISNSIKYRKPDVSPVIEIKTERLDDQVIIHFKDNGLGIDLEKKRDQIFGFYTEEDLEAGDIVTIRNYGVAERFYEFMFILLQL
jgi:PAS domain S-box-containing protein